MTTERKSSFFRRDDSNTAAAGEPQRVKTDRAPRPPRADADRKPRFNSGDNDNKRFDRKPRFERDGERKFDRKPRFEGGDKPRFERDGERKFDRKPRFEGGDKPRFERDGERKFDRKPRFEGGDKPRFERDGERKFDRKPRFEGGDKPRFERDGERKFDRKPRFEGGDKPRFERDGERKFDRKPRFEGGDKPRFERDGERRFDRKPRFEGGDKPRFERDGERNFDRKPRFEGGDRPRFERDGERKFDRKPRFEGGDKPRFESEDNEYKKTARAEKFSHSEADGLTERVEREIRPRRRNESYAPRTEKPTVAPHAPEKKAELPTVLRLNRFVAQSGVCSRREADELIARGEISVNGVVVSELGTKVDTTVDVVTYEGNVLSGERLVYILMNKPKDYVTTLEDPHADRTVIDLLRGQVRERVYPVGRLDKNTTGVLLLTNDGDLTRELTHPSFEKRKIYHVFLDRAVSQEDLEKLAAGIELEDGPIRADEVAYVDNNRKEVGIEIHCGRNRIVRRMFEHLDYKVIKLDRVYFAGFTKEGLRRGFWRALTAREVAQLKGGKYR